MGIKASLPRTLAITVLTPASQCNQAAQRLLAAMQDIAHWMDASRLKLNSSKTQIIRLGTEQQLASIHPGSYILHGSQ